MAVQLDSLSYRRISAIYVWVALIVLFGIWVPDTFLTVTTFKTILNGQAITAILALGLILPLSAGAFDLSIGNTLALGAMSSAWLMGPHAHSIGTGIAIALMFGIAVGILNGALVTMGRIDSFIATLGVGSIVGAAIVWMSGNQTIIGLPTSFQDLGVGELAGLQYPVWAMVVLALLLWIVLEHTALGRYLYATGGNTEAARLAGLPTRWLVFGSLVGASLLATFAGIFLSAQTASASSDSGPAYLLPAFAAAFLGSTQFKPGRFNVWGALVAVYVLATGVKGLQLAGAPIWIPELFNGVALLLAVGAAKWTGAARLSRFRRRNGAVSEAALSETAATTARPGSRDRDSNREEH